MQTPKIFSVAPQSYHSNLDRRKYSSKIRRIKNRKWKFLRWYIQQVYEPLKHTNDTEFQDSREYQDGSTGYK